MQSSNAPTKVPLPFANAGAKNAIPTASQIAVTPGAASLTDGFPPLTRTPIAAGGVPPSGADMNGILNLVSANTQWENAGGFYPYDAAFSTAIGGYPKGAVLARADLSGFWLCQAENNITNPDTGGAGWTAAFSSGVVGQTRNLLMNVAAASASATLTADELIVETALGGQTYRLASFNKTLNLSTTGAGGMDTGTAPTSGFVAIYAIYNPTTLTAALLATNASTVQPNVYGGANMPAGYTASALVSVWPTNASKLLIVGLQVDRMISFGSISALGTTTPQGTLTALSIASIVPANAKAVMGSIALSLGASAGSIAMTVSGTSIGTGSMPLSPTLGASQGMFAGFPKVNLFTPQTLYYTSSISGGTGQYAINLSSYEI